MSFERVADSICEKAEEVYLRNLGAYVLENMHNEGEESLEAGLRARTNCASVLFATCESPIEEIMAAIIPFVNTGYGYVEYAGQPNPIFGVVARSQYEIDKFRVDFLISCYCREGVRHVAIECDGHDFHEKTKAQAARDKSRDRAITAKGVTILRFTGSEIYRDPMKVANEVESVVADVFDEVLALAGHVRHAKDKLTGPAIKDGPL